MWNNGYEEARGRLEDHLKDPTLRFDSRDREATAWLLNLLENTRAELRSLYAASGRDAEKDLAAFPKEVARRISGILEMFK